MVASGWALHMEGLHPVASSTHATGVIFSSFLSWKGSQVAETISHLLRFDMQQTGSCSGWKIS
jgi:hypothetical protein